MDGTAAGKLDRSEGKISGEGNKGGDARTVAEAAGAGASVGAIAGGLSGIRARGWVSAPEAVRPPDSWASS